MLKDILKRYMWVGIALNVLSIVLVGFTAMMIDASTPHSDAEGDAAAGGSAFLGVVLILMGAFVQSLQYVFEEKVMSASEDDPNVAPTPPLLLVSIHFSIFELTLLTSACSFSRLEWKACGVF